MWLIAGRPANPVPRSGRLRNGNCNCNGKT